METGDDGRLALAFICERRGDAWVGYGASAERHTYFRSRGRELVLLDPQAGDEAFEQIAFRLVDDWIWYDEEEAPTERARYLQYGYPVRGANLRSEKLALLRRHGGRFSTLESDADAVRDALVAQWLSRP